jgi:hypothetical protein
MSKLKTGITLLLAGVLFHISCKKEYSCEGCADNNKNKPPIAVAGPDQVITLPTDSVLLDGRTSSDPDGSISSYLWTKISGPVSFNILKPSDSITKVRGLITGTYQFELKVTDNSGLSAKDTMRITVDAVVTTNHPPIANAGTDQSITLPTNAVSLDGSGSTDPENNITNYLWTKISGPSSFNIVNSNAVQTQVTTLIEGVYQFELKVTDGSGLFSKDTVHVTVNSSSTSSNEYAGPDIIITLPLDSVYLFGNTSTWPATFEWTQISGPSIALIIASNAGYYPGSAILARQLIPGFYSFKLIVNSAGIANADTVNVWVINDPQDSNTITFKNLKWHLADTYGSGFIDLDIVTPGQPNLFITWDQLRPVEIFLELDPTSQWFQLPSGQPGSSYLYDAGLPRIWIMRSPVDSSWVGKESNVKIKLL